MNYFQKSFNWFKTQARSRQIGLVFTLLLILCLSIFLIVFTQTKRYSILFNQLDSHDASQIINQLEQAHIDYQLQAQGSEILVAKEIVDPTRIKLMNSGLQLQGSVGFELFDKSDFGMTDFSQKINYQRALQGELERTIASLKEVRQVRVHLVLPERHLFEQANSKPSAAVSLHLLNRLKPQQINGIAQLISASVASLSKNDVTIIDQNGNTLTVDEEDSSFSQFHDKKQIETYLNNKIIKSLASLFAVNELRVSIDVRLNYDQLQREFIKPDSQGLIRHEKETQQSTLSKSETAENNQNSTREKSYEFGHEKEQFKRAKGKIERLTISVLIPRQTSPQTVLQIERLVQTAVGFDANRGDIITVEALIDSAQSTLPSIPSFTLAAQPFNLSPLLFRYLLPISTTLSILVLSYGFKQRLRRKKRQLLLAELKEWLNNNE